MRATQPVHSPEQSNPQVSIIAERKVRANALIYLIALAAVMALTPLMMFEQARFGLGLAIGGFAAIALVGVTLRAPMAAFYLLTFCAVVIEEDQLATPIGTDHLDIFSWPASISGIPERPIGLYILFVFFLLIAAGLATRSAIRLRGGPLIWPFLAFMACIVIGIVHGVASGGQIKTIVLEVRPLWYLFASYLIGFNLVKEKRHVLAFFWILVIGTAFKALQGVYIVFGPLHGHTSGVNEIMAHEQSYFFVLVLLLIVLCLLMKRLKRLMWVAIASLPVLLIALYANNRRADYVAFMLGAAGVWVFAIVLDKPRRKPLLASFLVCVIVFAGYIGIFGAIHTPISAPAEALVSVIQPNASDTRDISSNLYRIIEDYDLKFTEAQSPIIGYGFGRPFLQPIVLPGIVGLDPYYLYIPHNNILWIWMRLGPLGYLALWYLFGAAILRAGIIARSLRDPDLQLFALFAIGAVLIEIPLAYGDYQLYFFRNAIFVGLLLGLTCKLPSFDKAEGRLGASSARRSTTAPIADVGLIVGRVSIREVAPDDDDSSPAASTTIPVRDTPVGAGPRSLRTTMPFPPALWE